MFIVCLVWCLLTGHHLLKQYHKSHVVIRFALGGCANRPFYRIVAAQNKRARDGKCLEQVGCYDPLPNNHNERIVGLNFERIKYWIACGAHLSKPVEKLLGNQTSLHHFVIMTLFLKTSWLEILLLFHLHNYL